MSEVHPSGLAEFWKRYEVDRIIPYTPEEAELIYRVEQCINCGLCTAVCEILRALVTAGERFAGPRNIATSLSRSVIEFWAAADTIYYCTMCGACEAVCPGQVPIPEVVAMVRAKIARQQAAAVPQPHQALANNLRETGNIYGHAIERFAHRRPAPEYVVFTGCVAAHLEPESIENSLQLLDRLGVNFTTIDEVCCGGPTYVVGMPQVDSLIEHNLATILGTGTNKVLTSCPRCYLTLSQGPGYAGKLQVQHLASFLAGFDWRPMTGEVVTYHDPCELGRHRGEYDRVRQVLRQIAPQFVEMPNNRESGVCCGAGGGLRGPYTRLSRDVARGRLAEAMATGASVLITECGSCLHNFHNAQRSRDNVEIYGLSEYLNRLMQEHNTNR